MMFSLCKRRDVVKVCTFCTLLILSLVTWNISEDSQPRLQHYPVPMKNVVKSKWANHSELLILQWTTFFSARTWLADEGTRVISADDEEDKDEGEDHALPSNHAVIQRSCLFTWNRRRLADADYVMFHARDYSPRDMPTKRYTRNAWVFYCVESQLNAMTGMISHAPFNFSMTFSRDADIRTHYGKCLARVPPDPQAVPSFSSLRAKSKLAAALISNCRTHSKRENLIRQLKQYIPVDVYGACGSHKCPQGSNGQPDACEEHISHNYKFILAFENSLCTDYVTEKAFRFVQDHLHVVPVVYGLANYSSLLPHHSHIDVASFESIKQLANYLLALDTNSTAYDEYFSWRTNYRCVQGFMNMRDFCRQAHELHHRSVNKRCSSCDAWISTSACIKPRNFDNYRQLLNEKSTVR